MAGGQGIREIKRVNEILPAVPVSKSTGQYGRGEACPPGRPGHGAGWSGTFSGERHGSGDRTATVGHQRDFGIGHLSTGGLSPKLGDRFVDEAVSVQSAARELASAGVQRQLTAQ